MNQIAAAILVLSSTVCAYAASIRPSSDGFGGIMSLIALGLGMWGGLALLAAVTMEREILLDDDDDIDRAPRRSPGLGLPRYRSPMPSNLTTAASSRQDSLLGVPSREYRLSPETSAQISMVAQANGRSRHDVVEDILQRNLPRYSSRVAG